MRVLIAVVVCWGIGCASTSSNVPSSDFRSTDVALFDDAIDLVDAPVIVEGQWTGGFERRVSRADLIAAVHVGSLSSDLVKRRSAYRLNVKVGERLKGSSSHEIVLRVRDDDPGYESIRVNEDRLLSHPWIAFVKWEADSKSPELIAHWHLSPDSPAVRDKVDFLLRHPTTGPSIQHDVADP
ncbi:MAG: hypothetical protein WCF10_08135 [Polyangiales bacterium]